MLQRQIASWNSITKNISQASFFVVDLVVGVWREILWHLKSKSFRLQWATFCLTNSTFKTKSLSVAFLRWENTKHLPLLWFQLRLFQQHRDYHHVQFRNNCELFLQQSNTLLQEVSAIIEISLFLGDYSQKKKGWLVTYCRMKKPAQRKNQRKDRQSNVKLGNIICKVFPCWMYI